MEVPAPQQRMVEIHVVIARQGEGCPRRSQREDVVQKPVVLLEDMSGPHGLVAKPVPFLPHFAGQIGLLQEGCDEIFEGGGRLSPVPPQTVEICLEVMVTPRLLHGIERYIDQITRNDVNIGRGKTEQLPHPLEGAMNVGGINQFHDEQEVDSIRLSNPASPG